MTRSIEELTRIQHLWADAGDSHACALGDALAHVKLSREITPDELEAAAIAIQSLLPWGDAPKTVTTGEIAQAAITAFLEHRTKKGEEHE